MLDCIVYVSQVAIKPDYWTTLQVERNLIEGINCWSTYKRRGQQFGKKTSRFYMIVRRMEVFVQKQAELTELDTLAQDSWPLLWTEEAVVLLGNKSPPYKIPEECWMQVSIYPIAIPLFPSSESFCSEYCPQWYHFGGPRWT